MSKSRSNALWTLLHFNNLIEHSHFSPIASGHVSLLITPAKYKKRLKKIQKPYKCFFPILIKYVHIITIN